MNPLWDEVDARLLEHLRGHGWRVERVPALTKPDPSRPVGFDAVHPKHGRIYGATVHELVRKVERIGGGR